MHESALNEVHRREAMVMTDYHGWELPAFYASLEADYETARTIGGIVDLSCYDRIEVRGADRTDLLHRLSTNDLLTSKPGDVAQTLLVTDKGRLVDTLLLSFGENEIIGIASPGNGVRVANWIEKYTITEDISLKALTPSTIMISIVGPKAFSTYESMFSVSLAPGGNTSGHSGSHLAIGANLSGLDVVHLLVPNAEARLLWEHVVREGASRGLKRIGIRAFEAVRIAFGIPQIGTEISEAHNPFEVGLRPAISFTKGCYIGQEVIARLDTYGKIQKALVGLEFDAALQATGTLPELFQNERQVGTVTSVFPEALHGRFIGIGVARLDASAPGTALSVRDAATSIQAIVTKLPMTP